MGARTSNYPRKCSGHIVRTSVLLATLALVPLITGCGDEGSSDTSSDSNSNIGNTLICIAYLLVSGDDECLSWISSSSSGSTGSTSNSIRFMLNPEYEPNNDWMNANPLVMESSPSPDGFMVNGTVSDASDLMDTFSFVRKRGRYFRFKLCMDGKSLCNEYGEIGTLTAYIDVLDSYGNVLASTQPGSRNFMETPINAGLTYYVRVVAADTMGATVPYHLTGHEFEK